MMRPNGRAGRDDVLRCCKKKNGPHKSGLSSPGACDELDLTPWAPLVEAGEDATGWRESCRGAGAEGGSAALPLKFWPESGNGPTVEAPALSLSSARGLQHVAQESPVARPPAPRRAFGCAKSAARRNESSPPFDID